AGVFVVRLEQKGKQAAGDQQQRKKAQPAARKHILACIERVPRRFVAAGGKFLEVVALVHADRIGRDRSDDAGKLERRALAAFDASAKLTPELVRLALDVGLRIAACESLAHRLLDVLLDGVLEQR